jgi:hypothetical protein
LLRPHIAARIIDYNFIPNPNPQPSARAVKANGSYPDDPNWNPDADLDGDGKVDTRDIAIVAKQYGKTLSSMSLVILWTRSMSHSIQCIQY